MNKTEMNEGIMGVEFNQEVLERLAIWNHQRDSTMRDVILRVIGKSFSNRFKFIDDNAFYGIMKEIVCRCEIDCVRNSALDVAYAYSTSKDDDVKKMLTFDIADFETGEVIGKKYAYQELTELVDDNMMPVWYIDHYKVYDLESGEILGEVKTQELRKIYYEMFSEE